MGLKGFWDRLVGISSYDPAQRVLPGTWEPFVSTGGIPVMDPGTPLEAYQRMQVDAVWRSQPNVRKVVDYIARNVASIPLHLYERVDDNHRERISQHEIAQVLREPRPRMGSFRFWHSVHSDGLLYDRWAVFVDHQPDGSVSLLQLPSWRLHFQVDGTREVVAIYYWTGDRRDTETPLPGQDESGWLQVPLDTLLYDYGYAPSAAGLSPLSTLSEVLRETAEAIDYRHDVWENGARAPQYIYRPLDAPEWDDTQRNRFATSLRKYRKDGGSAGGWPLMEDGMEIRGVTQHSSDVMMDLDGRTLNAVEVASAWHIAPELVGIRVANFASLESYRQMLYRDSLGPYIDAWSQALQVQLVPMLNRSSRILYIEPHLDAKLRGSFEEQAKIGQATVGAPTMTRNEWRSRMNQPPVEGGDQLITPMSVLVGGLASPRDTDTSGQLSGPAETKSVDAWTKERPESHHRRTADLLSQFFSRQSQVVLSRIGGNDANWWDGKRWDNELSTLLTQLHAMTATQSGRSVLEAAGIDPDEYDEGRTIAFLAEAARRTAVSMNSTTYDQVYAATQDQENEDHTPARVFEVAKDSRAQEAATTIVTFAAGFGTVEAARQRAPRSTKTWKVNSSNPRTSHQRMDGETVYLNEDFSNGLPWPGAAGSDADEVAGCRCSVVINLA